MNKKSLAIIKLEALAIAMLAVSLLSRAASFLVLATIEAALAVVFLFLLFSETRRLFRQEFRVYAVFFLFVFAMIIINFFNQLVPAAEIELRLKIFFSMVTAFFVFIVLFRLFFTKKTVFGKVVSSQSRHATVETEFDLLAMVNAGRHVVKTTKKVKEGKKVELRLKQGLFGRKPVEIIE